MRYPADIIDASTDYFKIEILKNIKTGGGLTGLGGTTGGLSQLGTGSNRASQISDQYTDKPAEKTIILPIPQNIQDLPLMDRKSLEKSKINIDENETK